LNVLTNSFSGRPTWTSSFLSSKPDVVGNETRAARPPLPQFDRRTALLKVQTAEDAWSSSDPERVVAAYTEGGV
jgi:hypothetical protein